MGGNGGDIGNRWVMWGDDSAILPSRMGDLEAPTGVLVWIALVESVSRTFSLDDITL
jgi:hypothetical protein